MQYTIDPHRKTIEIVDNDSRGIVVSFDDITILIVSLLEHYAQVLSALDEVHNKLRKRKEVQ